MFALLLIGQLRIYFFDHTKKKWNNFSSVCTVLHKYTLTFAKNLSLIRDRARTNKKVNCVETSQAKLQQQQQKSVMFFAASFSQQDNIQIKMAPYSKTLPLHTELGFHLTIRYTQTAIWILLLTNGRSSTYENFVHRQRVELITLAFFGG